MQRRPHSPLVKTMAAKTQALKVMSLDMASSGALVPRAGIASMTVKGEGLANTMAIDAANNAAKAMTMPPPQPQGH